MARSDVGCALPAPPRPPKKCSLRDDDDEDDEEVEVDEVEVEVEDLVKGVMDEKVSAERRRQLPAPPRPAW